MKPVTLNAIHTYTDVDRAFWEKHLEGWMPRRIFDAHAHVADPAFQVETISEELKRSYWVMEMQDTQTVQTAQRCCQTVYPGRDVSCLCFGVPSLGWEVEGMNSWVQREAAAHGWLSLAVVRPTWVAEQVASLLDRPGVIGVKPYYAMIGYSSSTRDQFLEASIFDFMPHHQLEVLDSRGAWLTLHVPRADRLGHPDNIREIREIRRRYPRVKVVIAHLGRSYTLPHAEEGLLPLADDDGLFFDNSAVLNPDVHYLALRHIGPSRILYGTDNPIFYMRGRRQWRGRTYINRTSVPYHFNKERESPEIEATYTLYMYEALRALRTAFERLGMGPDEVEKVCYGNAARLAGIDARDCPW
jgi:uncharacterized protein